MTIHEILKEYWGYSEFRPLQQEIVESVISGNDTLALLPTGGGKSICFQVPAMAMDGVCLVISPLIALMKDQVENLEKIGIKSHAIYSGLHSQEIQLILGNCVHGAVKFLYLSPERLNSPIIQEQLLQMKISMIAVDEAHCISQWGFDFRPEYRKIIETKKLFPNIPLIALTATATERVVIDIQEQLGFKKKNVFRKSFERLNLRYVVRKQENKLEKILHGVQQVKGSGLIYVRNRKLTEEIANFLISNSINASFYHAGLSSEIRSKRQEDWINNKTRIMVCTNAFGMGIDKPDCRLVIHFEMPDCLEAYYQEAGRAGRNGKEAFCLLIYHSSDSENMRSKLEKNFPNEVVLKRIYDAICSYIHLPLGAKNDDYFDFDLGTFSSHISMNPIVVLSAIKILSQLEIIHMSDGLGQSSKLKILMQSNQLYAYKKDHPQIEELVDVLLRNYGGIFENYIAIQERKLAIALNCSEQELVKKLGMLHRFGIIDYMSTDGKSKIMIHGERVNANFLQLNPKLLRERKEIEKEKLESMIAYAENEIRCRSRVLLDYFNESFAADCGVCDVCKEKNVGIWSEEKINKLLMVLPELMNGEGQTVKELVSKLKIYKEDELVKVFRILLDKGILQLDAKQQLHWIKRD